MKIRLAAALLAACLLFPAAARAEQPETGAAGAALFILDGAQQIMGKNEHARLPMASTTKVMTALIVLETCAPDELVDIPDEAVGVEGSSAYLTRGERMSVRDLLYALMLTSGNDAAVALAVHTGGSVAGFSELMNARAAELGCTDTHFVTPNGLHDDAHYTSAHDLGRIACAAMQNERFRALVSTTYHETTTGDRTRVFKNKNKTLWQYDGGNGVKTGFTKAAGRCLVFSAERDGVQLVGVLLNCPNLWQDAFAMLDQGFSLTERRTLVSAERPVASVPVEKGDKKALAVYPKEDILVTLQKNGGEEISFELDLPERLTAPVYAGQEAGTLRLLLDGTCLRETPLIVTEGSARLDFAEWLRKVIGALAA